MPVRIIEDVVSGMEYSFDKDGGALRRNLTVSGLDVLTGPTGTSQTLYVASIARDQVTGFPMPQIFQQHESIPGLFVQKLSFTPHADSSRIAVTAKLQYSWQSYGLGQVQIKITGTRSVLHANRDPVTGNLFVVTYNAPGAPAVNGVPQGNRVGPTAFAIAAAPGAPVAPISGSNLVLFDVSTFHLMLEVQRVELGSPKNKAAAYAGRVNLETGWQGIGGRPRLWMCQSIEGESIKAGYYNVTYVFEYAPEGWWQIGLYQDPNTHIIPPDVLNAAGGNGGGILGGLLAGLGFGGAAAGIAGLGAGLGANQGWNITAPGQFANGQYGYIPPAVAFTALNIPNV